MRRMLLTMALAAFALPVAAGQCVSMAAQVQEVLTARADLPEETRAAAAALLDEGVRRHFAGDHAGSEAALGAAMQMLGLAPP